MIINGVSGYTVLDPESGWWERWEREWGEGGWMLVSTWKNNVSES